MDCGSTILIFLAFIQATCGQSVTLTGPSANAVEQESDTVYTCTGGTSPFTFTWTDVSVIPSVLIFNGLEKAYPISETKYVNFGVSASEGTATMTISNTLIEDQGRYRCGEGQIQSGEEELTVEVQSTRTVSPEILVKSNINDMFEATCEAVGGRPEETITWMLGDGTIPCDDPGAVDPTPGPGLSSTRSVCTFQATSQNNGQTLTCVISGHNVSSLNGEVTTTLETHNAPSADIMTVVLQFLNTSQEVRVSCNISDDHQPIPLIRNYYIFSDGILNLIHQSSTGVNFVDVQQSEFSPGFEFNCVAGNYLGNTTTYDPPSTTTLTPTTTAEPMTTEGNTTGTPGVSTTQPSTTDNIDVTGTTTTGIPNPSFDPIPIIIGCVVAVIVIIVIIIAVVYCKKKERFCFEAGGSSSGSSNKPTGRAVGSSNGSEKNDVESPLNGVKDVTAEEKTKPEAAPRGHGSIQHTNDNPNQDMYAMVDKKPSGGRGGDAPDRGSGPGQNEPQGMLYADLDLSHKAGHTDKHVPKNENDVVVYSSILV